MIRDICILTILITVLFGTFLGSRPFSIPDEGRYSEIPREMVERGDYVTPYLNGIKYFEKPPLLYWLQAGSIKAFGLSEWALRAPTALLALLGCLMAYIGGRLLYDRKTGFLSGLILSTSLLYFAMAHSITLDMAVSTAITGALLAFIIGVQYPPNHSSRQRRWFLWAMYVFSALAVLAKGLIGIVLPGMVIFVWMLLFNQWRLLKTLYIPSGIALFLLITLPWHLLVQAKNPEFFQFYFVEQHFERYFTMSAGRYQPHWFFIPIFLLGFFPWIVFFGQSIYNQIRSLQKTGIFLLLWAIVIFTFFSLSHSKLIPYILPIFPPLAILVGQYLTKQLDASHTKGLQIGFRLLSLCAIFIGLILISLPHVGTIIPHSPLAHKAIYTIATTLLIGAPIIYITYRYCALRTAITVLILTNCAFLLSVVLAIPYLDMRSTKPLTTVLNPLLQPNDEVIAYGLYYQDLPFYLRRKVTVVGWVGELEFGLRHQPAANEWIINHETFWQRWNNNRRVFMVVSHGQYAEIVKNSPPGLKFYILAKTANDLLVSNTDVKAQLPMHPNTTQP